MRAPRRCSTCGGDLRAHEAPEGICDPCLRARQTWIPFAGVEPEPSFAQVEPLTHDEYEEAMRETEPKPEEVEAEEYGAILWPTENGHEESADQIVRDLLEGSGPSVWDEPDF